MYPPRLDALLLPVNQKLVHFQTASGASSHTVIEKKDQASIGNLLVCMLLDESFASQGLLIPLPQRAQINS